MCPSRLPLRWVLVITMTRLSTVLSMAFQSMLSRFQLRVSRLPKSISKVGSSSGVVMTSRLSFLCSTVLAMGTITWLLRQMREMTKCRWVICATSMMVLPWTAGLTTVNSTI